MKPASDDDKSVYLKPIKLGLPPLFPLEAEEHSPIRQKIINLLKKVSKAIQRALVKQNTNFTK